VRGVISWVSAAALAFLLTAGAFLLLASLGGDPSEESLAPATPSEKAGPSLELLLDEDRLSSLGTSAEEELPVTLGNPGDEELSRINLTLEVSSENTALPDVRYYRRSVDELAAGDSAEVRFTVDLSYPRQDLDPRARIVEVRATTPEGVSAVRTAILPP
jgi:hypothetical protein